MRGVIKQNIVEIFRGRNKVAEYVADYTAPDGAGGMIEYRDGVATNFYPVNRWDFESFHEEGYPVDAMYEAFNKIKAEKEGSDK